jgi:DNA primase
LTDAALYYHNNLKNDDRGRTFWKKRGINEETIDRFLLGYSTGLGLIRSLEKKGYTHDTIDGAGLTFGFQGDYFASRRAIMPIMNGKLVANISSRYTYDTNPGNCTPKYLHLPRNSYQLYDINSIDAGEDLFLCEGQIDRLILEQAGLNAISFLGTNISKRHRDKYARILARARNIYCFPDMEDNVVSWRCNMTAYVKLQYDIESHVTVAPTELKILYLPQKKDKVDVNSHFINRTPTQIRDEIYEFLIPKSKIVRDTREFKEYAKEREVAKRKAWRSDTVQREGTRILETSIVDVLQNILGVELEQRGKEYICRCVNPEHEDANPSTRVYPHTNTFFCWACKEWGDAIGVIALARGVDWKDACAIAKGDTS